MNRNSVFARAGKVGIVCAFVFLAGCHELTGGGWIPGANGGKANFGFTAKCTESSSDFGDVAWFYTGQLQYQDRLAGVRFHADMDGGIGVSADSCEEAVATGAAIGLDAEVLMNGTCSSRPGKVTGTFSVTFLDEGGSEGTFAGRKVIVQTPDPAFVGPWFPPHLQTPCTDNGQPYYNEGYVQGGTLKSHKH